MTEHDYDMDTFASHLPVLEALKPKPKKVLEFGSGRYSTGAFLKMKSVTRLVSIETDMGWRERGSEAFRSELKSGRWKLLDETDEIPELTDFDLVFIDDGLGAPQRIETIAYVLSRKHPKVIVHDADHVPYMESVRAFTDDYKVEDGYSPHTAIIGENR